MTAQLMKRTIFILFVAFGVAHAGEQPQPKPNLHIVPTPSIKEKTPSCSHFWRRASGAARIRRQGHFHFFIASLSK
jgi:hypothetical protein